MKSGMEERRAKIQYLYIDSNSIGICALGINTNGNGIADSPKILSTNGAFRYTIIAFRLITY